MKNVVVELKGELAIILSDDGRIRTTKNKNYAIGQVIMMEKTAIKRKSKRITWAAAAAAAMFLVFGGSGYAYYTPYSYVSLDVNPSVEYVINRFDRVLEIKAINDDGKELLKNIELESLNNKDIKHAVYETVEQIKKLGFFDSDEEGGIIIATSSKSKKNSEELAEDLQESAEDATKDKDVVVESISVGEERVAEAHKLGVTPGKLNLVEKLQASAENPEDIDIEEWLTKSVKEILKETKSNRKADMIKGSESELDEEDDIDNEKKVKAEEKAIEKEAKSEEKAIEKESKAEEKATEKESKAGEKAGKSNKGN